MITDSPTATLAARERLFSRLRGPSFHCTPCTSRRGSRGSHGSSCLWCSSGRTPSKDPNREPERGTRRSPLHHRVFIVAAAASWSGAAAERYLRLLLALVVGSGALLVTERELREPGAPKRTTPGHLLVGGGDSGDGCRAGTARRRRWRVGRVRHQRRSRGSTGIALNVYRAEGMVAVTNWHQDPGYAAAIDEPVGRACGSRQRSGGLGSGRRWLDALVVGGVWLGVVMTPAAPACSIWRWRAPRSCGASARRATRRSDAPRACRPPRHRGSHTATWAVDPPGVAGDLSTGLAFRFDQGLSLGPARSIPIGARRGQRFP